MAQRRKPNITPGSRDVPEPLQRLPDEIKRIWRELAPPLAAKGVLDADEMEPFAKLCRLELECRKAEEALDKAKGRFYTSEGGLIKPHPASASLTATTRQLDIYYRHFLMTPQSKSTAGIDPRMPEKKESEIDKFIRETASKTRPGPKARKEKR